MSVIPFPNGPMSNSYGFEAVEEPSRDRYVLRGWAKGWAIYDNHELICTFHGPQLDLASKTLRLLAQEEVERMLKSCPEVTL